MLFATGGTEYCFKWPYSTVHYNNMLVGCFQLTVLCLSLSHRAALEERVVCLMIDWVLVLENLLLNQNLVCCLFLCGFDMNTSGQSGWAGFVQYVQSLCKQGSLA